MFPHAVRDYEFLPTISMCFHLLFIRFSQFVFVVFSGHSFTVVLQSKCWFAVALLNGHLNRLYSAVLRRGWEHVLQQAGCLGLDWPGPFLPSRDLCWMGRAERKLKLKKKKRIKNRRLDHHNNHYYHRVTLFYALPWESCQRKTAANN